MSDGNQLASDCDALGSSPGFSRRPGIYRYGAGTVVGASALVLTWLLLDALGRACLGSQNAASAGQYAGLLPLMGCLASIFGGMVAGVVAHQDSRGAGMAVGAACAVLLGAACAACYSLWGVPAMGESTGQWIIPAVVLAGVGGSLSPQAAGATG